MRKELGISPCVVLFESHTDLLRTIEEYVDFHNEIVEKYRDRLGVLLRQGGLGNSAAQKQLIGQSLEQQGEPNDSLQDLSLQQVNKKKDSKKKDPEERGGVFVLEVEEISIKVVGSTPPSSGSAEVSILFKSVEALNAKVASLRACLKLIQELPSRGVRADQRFLVVFKDGLPKQIIPTNESYARQAKFRYAEKFELTALQRV